MPSQTGLPTAATSPKASRRRKAVLLLLAIVIAVFVDSVYFSRPKIDPRLIGRWDVYLNSRPLLPDPLPKPYFTNVVFKPDGTGTQGHVFGLIPQRNAPFEWWVDENGFVICDPVRRSVLERIQRGASRISARLTGGQPLSTDAMKPVSVTDDLIIMEHVYGPRNFSIFKRMR
jgi:hypothetical protein